MNRILSSVSVLFRNSRQSLIYGSMAATAMALEELIESVVFSCPCEGHFAYGFAFLWAPAVLFFFPGILLESKFLRHPRHSTKTKAQSLAISRYFTALFATLDVFVRAGIAPSAWLVLSLLQKQYYACAYFGPSLNSEVSVFNSSDKCYYKLGRRSKELEERYKTRSQIAGWSLMLTALSILFISISIQRCIQKGKHLQLPSLEYYRHVEAKEALEQFHTKAKELAKEKARREIDNLFRSEGSKELNVRLKDMGTRFERKYGQYVIIPPDSPSYEIPDDTCKEIPLLPASPRIPHELLGDEREVRSFEVHQSACVVGVQFSSESFSFSEAPRELARIRLRQGSIDEG